MAMETAFDGATNSFRMAQKGTLQGSADSVAARELRLLWSRAHHLGRNNPSVVTAKNRLAAHWVGTGIKVKWSTKKAQKIWDKFAENPSVDGHGTLENLQNTWANALVESGEVFTRMLILKRKDMKIPLMLQTLEAEQLDPFFCDPLNTRFGIQFDSFGKPLVYHFFQKNPYDYYNQIGTNLRVPVNADDVLHLFERARPGQWRGIPKLASVMIPLYEIDELTDAALVRQKVAQAVGWIIRKGATNAMPLLGGIDTNLYNNENSGAEPERKIQKIMPGGVHYLEPDEEFEFASIDDIGGNLLVFLQSHWHTIASALDITYEQLTGDLSGVNFSSIRAGLIEFRRRVALIQQLIFINLALKPLTDRFKELAGLYESAAIGNATCKFVLPKTEWVDPLKDAQADVLEIRAGLATLEEKLAERGVPDIDEHMAQLAKEQGFEVILDSNPKYNTQGLSKIDTSSDPAVPQPNENPAPKPVVNPVKKPVKKPKS